MNSKPIDYCKLTEDLTVDDVIVGGGFSGVTTAYLLSKAGRNIALIDDGYIASGESGRTTAHLTYVLDSRFYSIKDSRGEDIARKAMESHRLAIKMIERNVADIETNCDFERVDGYLYPNQENTKDELTRELETLKQLGNNEVQLQEKAGTQPFDPGVCLKFPNQAQVHPIKYLGGLCGAIARNGGKIFTQTHVSEFSGSGVKTDEGKKVTAKNVVIATSVPVNRKAKMHAVQAPYRTYVTAFKVPKGSVSRALFWSTSLDMGGLANSYTYIRIHPISGEFDALIVGAEDHKTGQADDANRRFSLIQAWTKERFPDSGEVLYAWSGQIMNPGDGVGFIGRDKDNFYVATGYSGNGTTYGTIAGMVISDLILGRENSWQEVFDPNRKIVKEALDIISENFNVASKLVSSFVKGQEKEPEDLKTDSGASIKRGLTGRLAYYKDDDNKVHAFSSVCPHMGCSVSWNSSEKTFDCPCHGSRYTGYGKVVNGPANTGLSREQQ